MTIPSVFLLKMTEGHHLSLHLCVTCEAMSCKILMKKKSGLSYLTGCITN